MGRVLAGLQPGDVVRGAGLAVVAPARGQGVHAEALRADGIGLGLTVETGFDGLVRTVPDELAILSPGIVAPDGSTGACHDRAHTLLPSKWRSAYLWWFRGGSTPTEITRRKALASLKRAATNITHARNDCGRADHVSAVSSYLGSTTIKPDINAAGCRTPDGRNVVGFGDLNAGFLGVTCTTYRIESRGNTTIEADMLLNKNDYQWTTRVTGCFYEAVVEAIATHEFGHVFGLGHVSESRHPRLTMSTAAAPCDGSGSTLGLGDMLGLEARY